MTIEQVIHREKDILKELKAVSPKICGFGFSIKIEKDKVVEKDIAITVSESLNPEEELVIKNKLRELGLE